MNPADLNPDELLTEARAAFAASESPLRDFVFLHGLLLKLELDAFNEIRRGARPLTTEIVDELFEDVAIAVRLGPSVPGACVALDGAIGELERELAGKRGLLQGIDKRVAEERAIVRPEGAPAAITERQALREALGLTG
jgi:hypothetical protein